MSLKRMIFDEINFWLTDEEREDLIRDARLRVQFKRRFWYVSENESLGSPAFVADPRLPERSNPCLSRRAGDPHAVLSKEFIKLGFTLMAWALAGQVAALVATPVYAVARQTQDEQAAWAALGLLIGYIIGAAALIPSMTWMRLNRVRLAFATA